tara:strand:+ start:2034 stop:2447 length:414 start_codon:yes stop_codon:yes gene_type:complete
MSQSEGQLQDYSVDQLGGFVVMVAGAIGSLLLVVWQSKCHCRMNLCYIFQCERRPPSEEEMKSLKDQAKKMKDKDKKQDKILKQEDKILEKEDEILSRTESGGSVIDPQDKKPLSRQSSMIIEPEPEPEPQLLPPGQ